MNDFEELLLSLKKRIEALEKQVALSQLLFPDNDTGVLRVPKYSADPTAQKGLIIFNTATNTYKVSLNGSTWVTITTS